MYKFVTSVLCMALLAGCSHSKVTWILTPSAIKACGAHTKAVALTVHWDASKALPHGASIQLWINTHPVNQGVFGDGGHSTLWLLGHAKGSATTGAWMVPGTRITMTNFATQQTISQTTVPAAPCQ